MKDEHNKINRHLSRLIANLPLKRLTNGCDTRKMLLRKVEAELIFFATGRINATFYVMFQKTVQKLIALCSIM